MEISAKTVSVEQILPWRDLYREEMNCQIVHDSLHSRKGWTQSYLLFVNGATAGYGSVVVGGPWKGKPTVFEFYALPQYRSLIFDLFSAVLAGSAATMIETQTNDTLLTVMLHSFAQGVTSEKILFHDKVTTSYSRADVIFRPVAAGDEERLSSQQLDSGAGWVLEAGRDIVAAGGILFHYNRPYGDIYMEVVEPFRRRGLGSYLVQELKRVCYEQGSVPAARCNPTNVASRKTLQKAGFVPCGHILNGSV
jgi:GNAT superfamily N-acetyltransferase